MTTFTIRISGAEYRGEGETRLEAFAEAVNQAAPALREALKRTRARREKLAPRRPGSLERGGQ